MMKIFFKAKEILAHIFVYMIGITMMGILIANGIASHEMNWIDVLLISFFIYILTAAGLSFKQLLNCYKKTPAVVIDSKRIAMNNYWTVKHIPWHQVAYIRLDKHQRATLPRYLRFTVLTENGRKVVKINVHLLNIGYNDLMWALHQYHKNPEN